jgi:hypothetical protein
MNRENTQNTLATTNLEKFAEDYFSTVRSESVTFRNDTTVWDIGFWCYEFRQTQNLPPPAGYVAYTGVVVGGTNCAPGQEQVATVRVNVIGNFADCGCVNLHNRQTGKILTAFNLNDHVAGPGKYFRNAVFGIKDGGGALQWFSDVVYEDGSTSHNEGTISF